MEDTEKNTKKTTETTEKKARKPVRNKKKKQGALTGIFTRIIIILVLLAVMLALGYFLLTRISPVKHNNSSVLVKEQLSYCQEFVTLKYRYSDICSIKKSVFLSKSYSIVKYTGLVRAGIADLLSCTYTVSPDGKSIRILLPAAEVLGNDIVSQEVFDEQRSIFVPITLEEVFAEIDKSRAESLEELIAEGILDEAREYAKRIVRQIFLSSGFEEVIVE